MAERKNTKKSSGRGWDPVAAWYAGWVGAEGSDHHRAVVIPAVLDLLAATRGEHVLDIGCGPGVLAPHIAALGARYSGVDASRRMIAVARRNHGAAGRFITGDASRLTALPDLASRSWDAAVFMLSVQDIASLDGVIEGVAAVLRPGGRIVLVMTHPCFRVPRQSGWGWDRGRKLQYRRVDHYLTPLSVPMKRYGEGGRRATRSQHRPLQAYVDALAGAGLLIDRLLELPTHEQPEPGPRSRAERRALREIPLFLGLRAVKARGT